MKLELDFHVWPQISHIFIHSLLFTIDRPSCVIRQRIAPLSLFLRLLSEVSAEEGTIITVVGWG